MALILLVIIGVLAGWFGSIVTRNEDKYAIRRLILIALAASLVVGLLVNGGTFLGSLDWIAMGAAVLACAVALAGYHFYMKRKAEA
ncbi:MAG: hypothetical protein CL955_04700 [Erythrobacteraceae bacterium]|jgi:uncharacterized membrane protein YeaQ/YmgE (transglycosylase-associated protein family)|nr:hypothetical protein [Erythrobacteraceae bacterium]